MRKVEEKTIGDGLKVNLNQICRIKVLMRGVDAYNEFYKRLNLEPDINLRPNDIIEGPLHEVMNIFGDACYMGPEPPFEAEVEILPLFKSVAYYT